MSDNKKNVPKIRFPGYTDAWEQRKLGEVTAVYDGTHQTPDYKKEGIMFLSVENINTLKSEKYISIEAYENEFKVRPEKDDVLMTRIGDVGTANVVTSNEPIAYYVSLALLKMKDLNPYFLQANIHSPAMQDEIWKRTLHIAFPKKINKNEIEKVPINFPSEHEQEKIGLFFQNLDNLITLHQRKLDNVKKLKVGLLQKMFPRNGEDFPEVRFPEFTDAWEQRKLGELCSEFRSGEFIKASEISPIGDYAVYGGNGIRGYTHFYNRDGEYALIGRQGALCGNMQYSCGKAYFTEHAVAVSANNENETRFLYYLFGIMNLGQYSGQSAQPGLAVGNLIELKTLVPIKAEQSKISVLFSNLDNLITLHQRKLEHLQTQKKALLQQMFV
jgi:Restriction endonuclease S subunits